MKPNKINPSLQNLKDKEKSPNSVSVLSKWISIAEQELSDERAGRLSWLIASTVAATKLQQVTNEVGTVSFVMKGGTLLQHRLGLQARASRDLDGLVTEDLDAYIEKLDVLLDEPWGNITFRRTPIEEIRVPSKLINPRRFELILEIKGRVWRKILVEISPDEAGAGNSQERFDSLRLAPFGIPAPDSLVGIGLSYQIAQKIHGVASPHNPPEYVNNRARDLIDLILLRSLAEESRSPTREEIRDATRDIFKSRLAEARQLGRESIELPIRIQALSHWEYDYEDARKQTPVLHSLVEAVEDINTWLEILGL